MIPILMMLLQVLLLLPAVVVVLLVVSSLQQDGVSLVTIAIFCGADGFGLRCQSGFHVTGWCIIVLILLHLERLLHFILLHVHQI